MLVLFLLLLLAAASAGKHVRSKYTGFKIFTYLHAENNDMYVQGLYKSLTCGPREEDTHALSVVHAVRVGVSVAENYSK